MKCNWFESILVHIWVLMCQTLVWTKGVIFVTLYSNMYNINVGYILAGWTPEPYWKTSSRVTGHQTPRSQSQTDTPHSKKVLHFVHCIVSQKKPILSRHGFQSSSAPNNPWMQALPNSDSSILYVYKYVYIFFWTSFRTPAMIFDTYASCRATCKQ